MGMNDRLNLSRDTKKRPSQSAGKTYSAVQKNRESIGLAGREDFKNPIALSVVVYLVPETQTNESPPSNITTVPEVHSEENDDDYGRDDIVVCEEATKDVCRDSGYAKEIQDEERNGVCGLTKDSSEALSRIATCF